MRDLAKKLGASAARALGCQSRVEALRLLSGGASQESWRFDLHTDEQTENLVLRRAPPGRKPSGFSTVDLATEAKLLAAAKAAGVPVPTVRWQLAQADDCGSGYVMNAVAGEALPKKILRDDAFAYARAKLARQCGENLARLHAVPKDQLPEMPDLPAATQIQQLRALCDSFGEKRPVLELALKWLAARAPDTGRVTLVHGDFRNGNLMVGEDGLRAVLDWELAHFGDPMEDLGWLCVPSWRFGEIDKPVGGFGELQDLFAGYDAVLGEPVDASRVEYWQCLGTLKWGVICLLQAFTHLSGQRRSVELATIGRRVSEAEIDLLQIMSPRQSITAFTAAKTHPGLRPSTAELADAVASFVRDDLAEALTGRPAFHAKVAANALDIIEREALYGPAADCAEMQRLAQLLNRQGERAELNTDLCQRIRSGKLAPDTPGLLDHLWATTNARLAIDQPHYATYQKLIKGA